MLNRAQVPFGSSGRDSPNGSSSRVMLETALNGDQYSLQIPNGNGAFNSNAQKRRSNAVSDVMSRSSSSLNSGYSSTGRHLRNSASHSPMTFQNHCSTLRPQVQYTRSNSPKPSNSPIPNFDPAVESLHFRTLYSPNNNNHQNSSVLYRTWNTPPPGEPNFANGRPHTPSDTTNVTLQLMQELSSSVYSSGRSTGPSTSLVVHRLMNTDGGPQIAANAMPSPMPIQRFPGQHLLPISNSPQTIALPYPNGASPGPDRFTVGSGEEFRALTPSYVMPSMLAAPHSNARYPTQQAVIAERSGGSPAHPTWTASLPRSSANGGPLQQLLPGTGVGAREVAVVQPTFSYPNPGNGAFRAALSQESSARAAFGRPDREVECAPDESIQKITLV